MNNIDVLELVIFNGQPDVMIELVKRLLHDCYVFAIYGNKFYTLCVEKLNDD